MTHIPIAPNLASLQSTEAPTQHFTWLSPDGLTLAGVRWSPQGSVGKKTPVLCLPGLSRNTRDFGAIAGFLTKQGHEVIALDYRGRGASEWSPDWQTYTLPQEAADIDLAISEQNLDQFVLLGTSRGGLHAMAMAQRYPADRMIGVILNDIGPEIPLASLLRIRDSIGLKMAFAGWQELTIHLRTGLGDQFPALTECDWLRFARQLATETDGNVTLDYDPQLRRQLDGLEDGDAFPDLWPLYDGLFNIPVLILRGERSDLLSTGTSKAMIQRHNRSDLIVIPAEGHAPLLWDPISQQAILQFLGKS
ncbi:alpha/beta fold hydrolase [Roseibium sediminis]|uniref:alpha/beta fold hydrolase n=1 Tax=Roseibium sediminis TaxID=1775174 RepID=UPI00123C887C|nr:alpha/beta hydrolase [Roseibium sediminis]